MKDVLLSMLKSLPVPLLIEVFLGLAEEMAKKSDNKIDDQLVQILKAAFVPAKQP